MATITTVSQIVQNKYHFWLQATAETDGVTGDTSDKLLDYDVDLDPVIDGRTFTQWKILRAIITGQNGVDSTAIWTLRWDAGTDVRVIVIPSNNAADLDFSDYLFGGLLMAGTNPTGDLMLYIDDATTNTERCTVILHGQLMP